MENQNEEALRYLKTLIDIYARRRNNLSELKDCSYSAFIDYINIRDFVFQLKNLYYKLTNKEIEIDNEP